MTRDELFDTLYRKTFGRVYRFFRGFGIADDEAQDLAQDTFTRIYESFDRYRGEAIWGYVETTARNVLSNWVRARKTAKRSAPTVEIDDPEISIDPPAPPEPDYADREEQALRRKRLRQAIARLSEGQQQCLALRVRGYKYNEIATILRISIDAVKSRLRDAKKELRARLGEES